MVFVALGIEIRSLTNRCRCLNCMYVPFLIGLLMLLLAHSGATGHSPKGRPTTLAFDGPQQLQCGTRGCLGELRVRVTDDWDNLVENLVVTGRGNKEQGAGLELTLQSSAIATDGSGDAAKVVVAGSNKVKVSGQWPRCGMDR
jgi:hypothetical protein